jgi:hypothetical protein
MDGQDDKTHTNPYMALRAAKIARNQARLKELGLDKPAFLKKSAISSSRKRGPVVTKQEKNSHGTAPSSSPRRRSARITGLANNPDYKESNDWAPVHPNTRNRGTKRTLDVDEKPADGADEKITTLSPKPSTCPRQQTTTTPAANSVRTISLDVSVLVQKFLAKPMDTFGKYFVIETSFHEAAFPEDLQRLGGVSRLSFNKFSGVQPWKNVFYLWINIGGPTDANSLVNDFSHNGSRVTWFGGSKMREDSPVIQNLVRVGKESASNPSSTSGIILWCRQYDWDTRKLLPYTCLGRLAYESHIEGSHPVAFTWRLIDYEAIVGDESTRAVFRGIAGLEE